MRTLHRTLALAAVAALVTLSFMPAAGAAARRTVVTVDDISSYEGGWTCLGEAPYTCSVTNLSIRFQIHVTNPPRNTAITLGYRLVDVTATAGQDYTGPTSGTVTIPAGGYVAEVIVPLVVDRVAEPIETFQLRFTSSSIPADISDVGVGTILDGTQVPRDCTPTKVDNFTMYLTCTNRPASQRWHLRVICASIGGAEAFDGNIVTGNGRSTVSCGGYVSHPIFVVDP